MACVIKDMQEILYPLFVEKWGEIDMYPCVYKNPDRDKGEIIPEIFEDGGYKEMFLDSKKLGQIMFIDANEHPKKDEELFDAKVKIVFILNIQRIYGEGRRDDLAQQEAYSLIEKNAFNFEVSSIQKTIPTVFNGFKLNRIEFDDMHPYGIFAIVGNLSYKLSKKC